MAEENRVQEYELEQEQEQEQEQVLDEELVPEPIEQLEQQENPEEEKRGSDRLIMPFLYALLAAVGTFTLVLIIGIAVTIITRSA